MGGLRTFLIVAPLLLIVGSGVQSGAAPGGAGPLKEWKDGLLAGFTPSGGNYGRIGSMTVYNPTDRAVPFQMQRGMSVQPDPGGKSAPRPAPRWGARLRLVDEAGKPIAGAMVVLIPASGGEAGRLAAASDAEGLVVLAEPPAGDYESRRLWVVSSVGATRGLEFAPTKVTLTSGRFTDLGTWRGRPIDLPRRPR